MKIAIACDNGNVSGHFGHSPSFSFYEIENGKVISCENIVSPGHGHGILPDFIAEQGASVVIAGGMGGGAMNALAARNIEIIVGIAGDTDTVAEFYAKGELVSTNQVCNHHGQGHGHGHGSGGSCSCSGGSCSSHNK